VASWSFTSEKHSRKPIIVSHIRTNAGCLVLSQESWAAAGRGQLGLFTNVVELLRTAATCGLNAPMAACISTQSNGRSCSLVTCVLLVCCASAFNRSTKKKSTSTCTALMALRIVSATIGKVRGAPTIQTAVAAGISLLPLPASPTGPSPGSVLVLAWWYGRSVFFRPPRETSSARS